MRNWGQIFGANPWLWPFPVFCGSGKPLGDGIYWPKRESKSVELASSASSEKNANSEKKNNVRVERFSNDVPLNPRNTA